MAATRQPKIVVYDEKMIERIKAFNDAILAIIATIMVLEIPHPQTYTWGHIQETVEGAIIFYVSFLFIMSFYFENNKRFSKIRHITGFHVIAYVFCTMLLSLFPFMTYMVYKDNETAGIIIVYVIYVELIRVTHHYMGKRMLAFNKVKLHQKKIKLVVWELTSVIVVCASILLLFAHLSWITLILFYLPIRSLCKTLLFE
ncbi:MAG: TMEM175 family protein [Turicibacter sp.]|nr:TMEM175 family protein [Turicibacter sp.]